MPYSMPENCVFCPEKGKFPEKGGVMRYLTIVKTEQHENGFEMFYHIRESEQ